MVATNRAGGSGEWLPDYADRVAALVEDAGRANLALARAWAERSVTDDEWTVDTLTADMIEAWERLTPLAGRGLELWLELVQRAIRPGGPGGPGGPGAEP